MTEPTKAHRLAVARAWEGHPDIDGFRLETRRWAQTGLVVDSDSAGLERLAQLVADAEVKPLPETELVIQLTEVMREADRKFERVGGSTRHHVRDCLIPELEAAGLAVVRLPKPPERP